MTQITTNQEICSHRYCVIMCGGIGSRFWPYSRANMPKQFIDFLGTGRSLLQMSYDRILPVVPKENILVVTNEAYAALVKEQLPDLPARSILLEPARRNTAPCIAWAAYHIQAREQQFEESILRGFAFVESHEALLTLGINPSRPETGYGYIQIGSEVERGLNKVKTFTEKPDIELAKVFLETGEFFWNSGIFLWKAETIIKAMHEHSPEIAQVFDRGLAVLGTEGETAFIEEEFPTCMSISIDFAVMEKASNVYVETVDFGWSDLGTWSSLYDNSPKNSSANVTQNCRVLSYDSTGNIFAVRGDKLIAVSGLNDYIVSDAGDVLLICPKAEEQSIRNMVSDAKLKFGDKYL